MRKLPIAIIALALSIGCANIAPLDAPNPFLGTWTGSGVDSGTTFVFDAGMNFTYTSDGGLTRLSGTYSYTALDLNRVIVTPNPDPAILFDRIGISDAYAFSAGDAQLTIKGYPALTRS